MDLPEHGTFRRYVVTAMMNFAAFYAFGNFSYSFCQTEVIGQLFPGLLLGFWALYRHIGLTESGHSIHIVTSNGQFRQLWPSTLLEVLAQPLVTTSAPYHGDSTNELFS